MEESKRPNYLVSVFDGKTHLCVTACDYLVALGDGRIALYIADDLVGIVQPGLSVMLAGPYSEKGECHG